MSTDPGRSKLTVEELATRFRGEMIPLTGKFSYFSTLPIAEEDLRQYLNDPISAISPGNCRRPAADGDHPGAVPREGQRQRGRLRHLRAPVGGAPDRRSPTATSKA